MLLRFLMEFRQFVGAFLEVVACDGTKQKRGVERVFYGLLDKDGPAQSPYDGNWSMVDYITFAERKFETTKQGLEYICDHSEKWSNAVAVKAKDNSDEYSDAKKDKQGYVWLIGAWLAC